MKLEDELRQALRRQDPPADFAERVIRQAGPSRVHVAVAKPRRRWLFAWPLLAAAAAAAVLSVGVVHQRRAQQELAAKQAVRALQMVAEELNVVQNEVLNK